MIPSPDPGVGSWLHGTITGYGYGCRCVPCRKENSRVHDRTFTNLEYQPRPREVPITAEQRASVEKFEGFLRTDAGIPWAMEFARRIAVKIEHYN